MKRKLRLTKRTRWFRIRRFLRHRGLFIGGEHRARIRRTWVHEQGDQIFGIAAAFLVILWGVTLIAAGTYHF